MIPIEECIQGHLYRIHSRNLDLGVYREDIGGFIGIREKFGDHYLFTEYHSGLGPPYGTVHPQEDLGPCPIENLNEGQSFNGKWRENRELFGWLDAQPSIKGTLDYSYKGMMEEANNRKKERNFE